MNYVPRVIGVLALAILVLGARMLIVGAKLDNQRRVGAAAITRIPPESEYVRAVYDQPVGTDRNAVIRAIRILGRAGQSQHATLLERFFSYCGVKRLLDGDIACSRMTVRAAVDKVAGLAPGSKWPVEGPLESKLAGALSFSLADEMLLRKSVDERTWESLIYDGPGILRYHSPVEGAYLLLAVRNRSEWEITSFRVRLQLPSAGSQPLDLECSSRLPFPFYQSDVLARDGEAMAYCERAQNLDNLLAAVRSAKHQSSLSVWGQELTLNDPLVHVVERGESPVHRFTVQLAHFRIIARAEDIAAPRIDPVSRELEQVSCEETANCPSAFESASLPLYGFFSRQPAALPVVIGLLVGLGIGGLVRRSFLVGGIFAAALLACVVGAFIFWFHTIESRGGEKGWALMGMMKLIPISGIAFMLWLSALFLGVMLARPLWKGARPASAANGGRGNAV